MNQGAYNVLVAHIAEAISHVEGFHRKELTIARRQNNPGNLRSWGKMPVKNGYACFPSLAAGWAALHAQVRKNLNRRLTLYQFFEGKPGVYAGYAPAADNNKPHRYAELVSKWVDVPPDVVVLDFLEKVAP